MKRISVTSLKKKYPHPVQPLLSHTYGDYCVGGALCREVGFGEIDFPNEQQLKEAVGRANRFIGYHWYELTTKQHDEIYRLIKGCIVANDIGSFDLSWKMLGRLLHWRPE